MITYIKGNIFDSKAEVLVSPVNCVGVSGAGLAKQFKERFPDAQKLYERACFEGKPNYLKLGDILLFDAIIWHLPKSIVYFPTKYHWKDKSKYSSIKESLYKLKIEIQFASWVYGFNLTVAIPKIGCGLGGLDWNIVKEMIEEQFKDTDINVEIYE